MGSTGKLWAEGRPGLAGLTAARSWAEGQGAIFHRIRKRPAGFHPCDLDEAIFAKAVAE